jgi:hypothetical protein
MGTSNDAEDRAALASTTPASGGPTGFRPEISADLDDGTAVAYRGEPLASELALLHWRMSESERRSFAGAISRITTELRAADEAAIEQMLHGINGAVTRTPGNDPLDIRTEDVPESLDEFSIQPASGGGRLRRRQRSPQSPGTSRRPRN